MKYLVTMITRSSELLYLTPRRPTQEYGISRTTWSKKLSDSKIFNTKGAATRSLRASKDYNETVYYEIVPVEIIKSEQ